ncbi:MAG: hypothetical protein K2X71_29080 [Methylobacterium sp.]|uniref:hypothetical protein n=1 Tax=Methylobacterium sp. TaxID=409 RepID=UPI002589F92A|nr:hypothetical protein [Methylobacterium sp.]MBY0300045.1 hypothetical protein [Methylobacterium sp.]
MSTLLELVPARLDLLGVPDLAGLVDLLAGQAEVGNGGNVPGGNVGDMLITALATVPGDFSPLLRGIVLVGEAPLGERLDLDGMLSGGGGGPVRMGGGEVLLGRLMRHRPSDRQGRGDTW